MTGHNEVGKCDGEFVQLDRSKLSERKMRCAWGAVLGVLGGLCCKVLGGLSCKGLAGLELARDGNFNALKSSTTGNSCNTGE